MKYDEFNVRSRKNPKLGVLKTKDEHGISILCHVDELEHLLFHHRALATDATDSQLAASGSPRTTHPPLLSSCFTFARASRILEVLQGTGRRHLLPGNESDARLYWIQGTITYDMLFIS